MTSIIREYDENSNEIHYHNTEYGLEIWREFDTDGNCISYKDSFNNSFIADYDEAGRCIRFKGSDGTHWIRAYDIHGNILHTINLTIALVPSPKDKLTKEKYLPLTTSELEELMNESVIYNRYDSDTIPIKRCLAVISNFMYRYEVGNGDDYSTALRIYGYNDTNDAYFKYYRNIVHGRETLEFSNTIECYALDSNTEESNTDKIKNGEKIMFAKYFNKFMNH